RHTRWPRDWSSDVCSSDLAADRPEEPALPDELALHRRLLGRAALDLARLGRPRRLEDALVPSDRVLERLHLPDHPRVLGGDRVRSEERRVGKGCVWWAGGL